ncbi:MAG: MFS transporter [Lentisphaeria bacterium]|nr:MFS transporter [Lentisphaeria bacterium]
MFSKIFTVIRNDKGVALAASWSFNQLAYAIVYPFIPIYLCQERGLPYSMVSMIFPLLGLAVIIAPVPCGWLTDKFGYAVMMLAGQFFRGIIFFLLAFFVYIQAPFWWFVAALMINTAVGTAFQVGSDAYLVVNTVPEKRSEYYSKIRMGYNIGWTVGPMLGAFFAKTPFWAFFILTGMLCMAGTVYTHYCCCRLQITTYKESYRKTVRNIPAVKLIFGNIRFMLLMLGTLLLMLLVSQLYSTMSVFATGRVGISTGALGTIYSLNGFMVLVLQVPLVALLTRLEVPIQVQLCVGTLLYAAGYFQLGLSGSAVMIAVAVTVLTIGEIITQPALYTSVSQETDPENAGRMMSVSSLMRGIGYSVGPWLGGILFTHASSLVMWSVLSCFALAAAVMFATALCLKRQF